jgi:CheY-like chemotaxis protein
LRVIAYIPDLLFGSAVLAALQGAGHEAVLAGDADSLGRALEGADVLVVDLTSDVPARLDVVRPHLRSEPRTLAFYSHVENEVRTRALEAGFDQVVPRSRMAREGAALVQRLSAA